MFVVWRLWFGVCGLVLEDVEYLKAQILEKKIYTLN